MFDTQFYWISGARYRLAAWRDDKLAALPTWSGLRTLGQSRLLSLTVFAPFLGTLILFNQNLIDWLQLSPWLAASWGGTQPVDETATRAFTLGRLQVTYFGLVILGLGSFVFTIFCPGEVKRYSSVEKFVEGQTSQLTIASVKLLVRQVAADFHNYWADNPEKRRLQMMAYPWKPLAELFEFVFYEIAETAFRPHFDEWAAIQLDEEKRALAEPNGEKADTDDGNFHWLISCDLISHRGVWNVTGVVDNLVHAAHVNRVAWEPIEVGAQEHRADLLTLRYHVLDRSRPVLRIFVAASYFVGFGVLSYPAAETLFVILWRTFVVRT